MNKYDLRTKYIEIRKLIKNKAVLSDNIAENVLTADIYANSKNIGIYVNLPNEVSTEKLILQGFADKKNVSVPAIEGQSINFYSINSLKDLYSVGAFGIQEPIVSTETLVSPESIDLLIIPGICFDLYGNRLRIRQRLLR